MDQRKHDKEIVSIPNEARKFQRNITERNIEDKEKDDELK